MSKEEQTLYYKLKGSEPDLSRYREGRQLEESETQFIDSFFDSIRSETGCLNYFFYGFILFALLASGYVLAEEGFSTENAIGGRSGDWQV